MPPSPLSDLANCDLLIANQLQCNPQNQSFPMSNVPKKNPFSAVLSGPKLCWVVQHVLKCHMDSILRNSRRVILLGTPCVTVPQIDQKSEMWSTLLTTGSYKCKKAHKNNIQYYRPINNILPPISSLHEGIIPK